MEILAGIARTGETILTRTTRSDSEIRLGDSPDDRGKRVVAW
jgi:hypothetical protein